MPLTIKKSNWDPKTKLTNASPLQKSLWVRFYVYNNGSNFQNPLPNDLLNKTFSVVLSEPIEIQVETDWTESGGAEIAKKVNQIFNPKAIRALAGNNANAHAPNDEWTQKTTEMGKPLNAKLKFRIYDKTYTKTKNGQETNNINQTYSEMIRFLTLVCAPRIKYSLTTNAIDPLIGAAKSSKEFFKKLRNASSKNAVDEDSDEFKSKPTAEQDKEKSNSVLNSIVAGINAVKNDIESTLVSETRYNYTIGLESNILLSEKSDKLILKPDWYIKSFNWLPSTEMLIKNDKPFPLWVDFDIDLETCMVWPKELIHKFIRHNIIA